MPGYLPAIINLSITRTKSVKRKQEVLRNKHLRELKLNIEYSKAEMDSAMRNFNNVTEPRLVDFYIYRLRAEQNRYTWLLHEYKRVKDSFDTEE